MRRHERWQRKQNHLASEECINEGLKGHFTQLNEMNGENKTHFDRKRFDYSTVLSSFMCHFLSNIIIVIMSTLDFVVRLTAKLMHNCKSCKVDK